MDRTVKLFLNTLTASFANHADTFMRNVSCNSITRKDVHEDWAVVSVAQVWPDEPLENLV